MKRLIVLFICGAYASCTFAADNVALTVSRTTKTVTPDGVVGADEPWQTAWINLTAEKSTNAVHGMSAHFQIAHNDTYLWIFAEQSGNVTIDTNHVTIPNGYERDCFEIFIAMDTVSWKYAGAYGEANNYFRMQRASDYPWGFDDSHSIGKNNADFMVGQVDNGDGSFTQEWQIPWTGLIAPMTDSGNFDGQFIKFEIQASDNTTDSTGGRNEQLFWLNNSDNEYRDSRTLALVRINFLIICKKSARIGSNGVILQPDCWDPWPPPGLKSNNISENTIVFPNPVAEFLNIINEGTLKYVTLRNILGEELIRINVQNEKTIVIPVAGLASSLYLVTLTDKSGMSYLSKVVKK